MENLVWTEKHRPDTLEEYIGSSELKNKIRELIKDPKAMPNMMFVSKSPGTGKTTMAHVIKNEIDCPDRDFLIMNSSDERKLEHIRGKVKDFSMTLSSRPTIPRIVLMDEFDGMRSESQDALRFMMERYSGNCKFFFTLNDENKIIEPIKSRCVIIYLKQIPKTSILMRLSHICEVEHITTTRPILEKLIDVFYPDMRSMINKLQELGSAITAEQITKGTSLEDGVYALLRARQPFKAREMIITNGMDCKDTLKYMMETMLKDETLKNYDNYKKNIYETVRYTGVILDRLNRGPNEDGQVLDWLLTFLDRWAAKGVTNVEHVASP